ncbi:hypothetical protein BKA61DRAFT_623427 [Leptodontidium sp. MPI-SDFR-AT-0119]|nr:hypothetical protein BKA61DRAFT_623427 [Leptodontidium sp. MPI-SDFR-AT-0119]
MSQHEMFTPYRGLTGAVWWNFWAEEIREATTDQLFELVKEAFQLHKQLDNIHDEVGRRVLVTTDVIGVTIIGLCEIGRSI